ncbi:hydroxysqualene dehydroxylase [Kribbella sp. CA-247076]|uniref:hydroxysqualene dehydroxylase n=1 Tax=Kribbella sp. CA-247076 TaxID=3239941 RepID=UPI003D917394
MPVPLGRDARIETHRPPAPHKAAVPDRRVIVVGGGIAGLSAATALTERGVKVTLLEGQPYLGGRVASWSQDLRDGSTVSMGRGFHAFFRQYYNLRQLLRRTDPELRRLVGVPDYPLVDAEGRTDTFRGLPTTPPWNAVLFALRSPTFGLRDLLRLNARAALPLATVSVPEVYRRLDSVTADDFLAAINFPSAARHLAFEVFSRSFFAPPSQLSAAEMALMFHLYFLGSSEGLLFDVPDAAFGPALWEPLGRYLENLGADVATSATVDAIEVDGPRRFRVHAADRSMDADAVVLAADLRGLQHLLQHSPDLGPPEWREQMASQLNAPPFLVHRLWLDRPVDAARPAFLGTAGWGELDNVSVLERYEAEARRWAGTHGGSVVELHAYSADPNLAGTLATRLEAQLHRVYPETADAKTVDAVSLWNDDCPWFTPGSFAGRPPVRTPVDGLVLAGDGIRIDLPVALMERAATTGVHAANLLLGDFGQPGHELYSVPNGPRIRGLHRPRQPERASL